MRKTQSIAETLGALRLRRSYVSCVSGVWGRVASKEVRRTEGITRNEGMKVRLACT